MECFGLAASFEGGLNHVTMGGGGDGMREAPPPVRGRCLSVPLPFPRSVHPALPCPIHPSRPSAILSSAFGPTRIATLRLLPPCFGCLSMYLQLSSRRFFASLRSSFLSSSSLFRFARSSFTSACLLSLAIALDSLRRGSFIITSTFSTSFLLFFTFHTLSRGHLCRVAPRR